MIKSSILTLLLFLFTIPILKAQNDFSELKAEILEATSEFKKLEGIIYLGSAYNRAQIDSIYFYVDSLSYPNFENKEFANVGRQFLEGLIGFHQGDFPKAIEILEVSRGYFEKNGNKGLLIKTLNFLGIAYTRTNEIEQAITVQDELITLIGDDPEFLPAKSSAYGNKANAYRRVGDFANAIYSLEKALEYNQGDSIAPLAISYMNMGQMLTSLKLHERALEAYWNIKPEKIPSESIKGAVYSGMAQTHTLLGNQDSAYYYYSKSFETTSRSRNWQQTLMPQMAMAKIAIDRGDLELAQTHLIGADSLKTKFRYPPPFFVDLFITKMKYEILDGKLQKALEIAKEFETFINDNSIAHLSKDGFRIISEIYLALGDKDKALEYEKINSDLDNHPVTLTENARAAEQRTQLALLEKDKIIEQESSQRTYFQNLSSKTIALAALFMIISVLLFRYYRKARLDNVIKDSELKQLKKKLNDLSKESSRPETVEHITLKSKALIKLNELNYISSDGPYVEFHLNSKSHPEIDRNSLKSLLEELPSKKFIQVHRSHIVNIDSVKSIYSNKVVLNNGQELSVSRSYKDRLDLILRSN